MNIELWRDIAVVWLSLHALILLLIPLAIFYLLVRGINWVHRKVPPLFLKAQGYSQIMRRQSEQIAGKVAHPLIVGHSQSARVEATIGRIFSHQEISPSGDAGDALHPKRADEGR